MPVKRLPSVSVSAMAALKLILSVRMVVVVDVAVPALGLAGVVAAGGVTGVAAGGVDGVVTAGGVDG